MTGVYALPGPALQIKHHVIRGQPKNLQEAVAHATEVHAMIEAENKETARRSDVRVYRRRPPGRNEEAEERMRKGPS